jgi:hypothetical protein
MLPRDAASGHPPIPAAPDPVQGYSPAGQLLHLLTGYWVSQAIHAAAVLGVADHLGRRGRPVDELAAAIGADADALHRLLRALASVGVFAEVAPRTYAQSPMGALLATGMPGNLRDFARMQGDAWHWDCWGGLADAVRTGTPAITARFGAADCFAHLARHPASATVFDAAMAGYASQAHAAIAEIVPLEHVRTIVDVGGGTGALLATLVTAAPAGTRGILFDRADVVAGAAPILAEHGVADRCAVVAGDFFADVPPGGDLYVMSSVLHDWNDDDAVRILGRVRNAMATHARLVIVENVIPADGSAHPAQFIDLEMLLVAAGRERTATEYATLLATAGLAMTEVVATATSVSAIIARRADTPR